MEFDGHEKEAIAQLPAFEKFRARSFFKDQYDQWRYAVLESR
jgi:hypothetical protein